MANPTPPRKKNRRRKEKIRNKIKLELPGKERENMG